MRRELVEVTREDPDTHAEGLDHFRPDDAECVPLVEANVLWNLRLECTQSVRCGASRARGLQKGRGQACTGGKRARRAAGRAASVNGGRAANVHGAASGRRAEGGRQTCTDGRGAGAGASEQDRHEDRPAGSDPSVKR